MIISHSEILLTLSVMTVFKYTDWNARPDDVLTWTAGERPRILILHNLTFSRVCFFPPSYVRLDFPHSPGDQLLFSFLKEESVPAIKLLNGLWNCSAPYSAALLHHLSCDLRVECVHGEDEANCPYSSEACGTGYMTLGGACFAYVRNHKTKLSWKDASDLCFHHGGQLAILNSVDKWESVIRTLPYSKGKYMQHFIGIRMTPSSLPLWYSRIFQWADGITAFLLHSVAIIPSAVCMRNCGLLEIDASGNNRISRVKAVAACHVRIANIKGVLCEKATPKPEGWTPEPIAINDTARWQRDPALFVDCPLGHYTHRFLACDYASLCLLQGDASRCESSQTSLVPSFTCTKQVQRVSFTLVCNHRADCYDGSDEDFCFAKFCMPGSFWCGLGECLEEQKVCDGWADCQNGKDEVCEVPVFVARTLPPPALVTLSPNGRLVVRPLNVIGREAACPHTHFQCPDNGYCLPVFLRCNKVHDCPGHEDEAGCSTCPGFYRCRGSAVCLHYDDFCDGRYHCPKHDDEICPYHCPYSCLCQGYAFICTRKFDSRNYPLLRFIDATGSGLAYETVAANVMLINLTLANCSLVALQRIKLWNLLSLNLQDNRLDHLRREHLVGLPRLRELNLAGNPLDSVFKGEKFFVLLGIVKLDLSRVAMPILDGSELSDFPNLRVLSLTHSKVDRITGQEFRELKELRVLDLRGCPMTWISRELFQGLDHLEVVRAQNFKICCPALLPAHFNPRHCLAPSDEVSSCEDLLRGNVYKFGVFVLSLSALVGNVVSFVFRTWVSRRETQQGYGVYVTHLSVSDFLMGVYLAVIGVADQLFRGTYLWNDTAWKHSDTCAFAGFLSLVSSEVSALIVCLITLDRFLVLCFPFSRTHFSSRSAHAVSGLVWIGVTFLAALPLTSHWDFYSQTGICIPLPTTRTHFDGHHYSFGIFIVFNFIVFVFISAGQLIIYWIIQTNSLTTSSTTKTNKDMCIARRLITVAMTDFLCWFPIGVVGLLASNGVPILGEINVALVIFILPLNSAVNPCLYTLNVITERRKRSREEILRTSLLAQLKTRTD